METRRARRREKKKQRMARQENIPCIVFLATDEESFELQKRKRIGSCDTSINMQMHMG